MKLSLILATVLRTDELSFCLSSLAKQTVLPHEVLVVDQNPDDRLTPVLSEFCESGLSLHHLWCRPPGLSRARNLGLTNATGDFVGFPDDDCWYEPDTLDLLSSALQSHPEWDGAVICWVEQSQALGPSPSAGVDEELSVIRWRQYRDGSASSISLFLRTDLVRRLGGFDDRLGVGQWYGSGEEIDIVLASLSSGARIGRVPSARVHHRFSPASAGAACDWRVAMRRGRGTGALYVKHRLSWWVIVRGCLAPAAKVLFWPRNAGSLRSALATGAGRAHGAMKWWLTESRR